jgi:hypothetical protein
MDAKQIVGHGLGAARCCRGGVEEARGMMAGGITARTQDYFGLLVGASIVALCSGVVATLCVKYELRWLAWFWAAAFFGSALVAAYCLGKLL